MTTQSQYAEAAELANGMATIWRSVWPERAAVFDMMERTFEALASGEKVLCKPVIEHECEGEITRWYPIAAVTQGEAKI